MKCQKCKSTENLSKNSVTSSGKIQYICRKCNTERFIKFRSTTHGKNTAYEAVKNSIAKHPEKQSARKKVYYALKVGKLIKPEVCQVCSSPKELFGHHTDYTKPLEVEWICRECHTQQHRAMEIHN